MDNERSRQHVQVLVNLDVTRVRQPKVSPVGEYQRLEAAGALVYQAHPAHDQFPLRQRRPHDDRGRCGRLLPLQPRHIAIPLRLPPFGGVYPEQRRGAQGRRPEVAADRRLRVSHVWAIQPLSGVLPGAQFKGACESFTEAHFDETDNRAIGQRRPSAQI